jgi:hypothetical protein
MYAGSGRAGALWEVVMAAVVILAAAAEVVDTHSRQDLLQTPS